MQLFQRNFFRTYFRIKPNTKKREKGEKYANIQKEENGK